MMVKYLNISKISFFRGLLSSTTIIFACLCTCVGEQVGKDSTTELHRHRSVLYYMKILMKPRGRMYA